MATLDVIRRLTLRAKAEGFSEAERDVKSLGETYETSARRQLSVEKSLQNLERRFITGAKAQQDFEKVQRQVNAVIDQNPALQARANAVLAEAHKHLLNAGQSGGTLAKQFAVLSSEARGLAASLGPVGALLLNMGPAGLAAGAALGAAAIGMKKLMDESLAISDRAGKLLDLSDTVGLTTRQLQALEIAGEGVGFSLDDIATSTTKFAQKLSEIREGSGSAAKALHEINPALLIQVQSAKTVAEAYDIVNKQLVKMDDVTKKVALSRELFGKGGARQGLMAGALEDKGGIDAYANSLNQLDIINNKTLKSLDDLGDAFKLSMRLARQGIDLVFAEDVLKRMKDFSDRLLEISRTMREASPKNIGIAQLGEIVDSRLIDFVVQLATAIGALVQVLAALARINLKTLLTEGFSGISTAASDAADGVKQAADALNKAKIILSTPGLPAGDPGGLQGAVRGAKSLNDALEPLPPKLGGVAKGLVDTGKAAKDAKLEFDLYVEGLVLTGQMSKENSDILRRMGVTLKEDIPAALKSSTAETIRFHNAIKQTQDLAGDFMNDFVSSLVRGESATKSLGNALGNLGQSLTRSGIKQITDDLVGSLNSVVKSISGISGLGGPAGAAIGVGISLFSKLFGDDEEDEKRAQEAADNAKRLQDAANSAINSLRDAAVETSAFSKQLLDLQNTLSDAVINLTMLNQSTGQAFQLYNQALTRLNNDILKSLTASINEFTDKGFLNQIQAVIDQAHEAEQAMMAMGTLTGANQALVTKFLVTGVQAIIDGAKLTGAAFEEMLAVFPSLQGSIHEFSNAAEDAAAATQAAADAAAKAAEAAADAAAKAAAAAEAAVDRLASITDRAFAATVRGDDLGSQLARFDYDAQRQREAEIKAGGENIANLDYVLSLERQNIIDDFNANALKAQQDAADQMAQEQLDILENQIKAEKERVDTIKKANQDIIDYLNGLLTGSLSPLSAKAQLDAARQLYEQQLALAKSGDLTALQNITKSADTLLNASKAFYGSSLGYQRDFQLVQGQLGDVAGAPITPTMVANDNIAAISAAGFADVSGLLERLVELAEEGNLVIPETINGQTLILAQESRFAARK